MTIGTSNPLWCIQGSQRALNRLKVCTHWAGTNRLPATLLVGRCVSQAQRSDGCSVILRPCELQVCLPLRKTLFGPALEQQAVFTWAKFILPGQKYENDLPPAALSCLTLSERRDRCGGRMWNITWRMLYVGLGNIIHLFFMLGFCFSVLSS